MFRSMFVAQLQVRAALQHPVKSPNDGDRGKQIFLWQNHEKAFTLILL